ncbi:hypothetical protein PAXRUDRAFT_524739 [Paxillus rubicundulus Ve08.2h10]|uniref:Heterokaryon incompatibility domain-containing protein n=1 Tax=Paxillus rubicundulus Ve08.2h10 TaxID=930991 RepID=A0A0D0D8F3_9AGAM|nr:hypothetical protein PAXRUDRAFT_524739 [Paxillus rubicundulus Ve08.2h10]
MAKRLRNLRRTLVRAVSDPSEIVEKCSPDSEKSQSSMSDITQSTELIESGSEEEAFSIQDAIDLAKSEMPLRLICTNEGKFYDRNDIEMRFKAEHRSLYEPTAVHPDPDTMLEIVRKFFAYAMLSHRWEAQEPMHKDVEGSDAFSLPPTPGAIKLQTFCRHAKERGFRWAWSDTCCIDKTSTSELQKSIFSMFKWYRGSDLTIVYLSDVVDNSTEAFRKSIWFKRGWTLQELIAPNSLLFFQKDWTLLRTSDDLPLDNYKESSVFRSLVSEITGIEDSCLTTFDPASSTLSIRQRMSWAAHRKTTEVEDIAYCLMGIFDVHFPVMYGEGDSAFRRLQVEIMAKSDDPSLFDWTGKPGSNSLLASSPKCFDPFSPPIVDPVPATMVLAKAIHKIPFVKQIQRGVDRVNTGFFNLQERVGVNAQHPANYLAGAKVHCHGLEYSIWDVEETKAMTESGGKLFQYHIIAESLHPVTVTLLEPIKTGFGYGRVQSKYLCIFRVWDQSLATGRSTVNDGNHPLRQAFVGHLLVSQPGGIYRRIRVKERIVAKLAHPLELRMILQLRTLMIE